MTETNITICPFLSTSPYFVGCDNGTIMLLPSRIKCEFKCSAWSVDHCVRLSNDNVSSCNCKGDANV